MDGVSSAVGSPDGCDGLPDDVAMLRPLQPEHRQLADDRCEQQLHGQFHVGMRALAPLKVLQAPGLNQLGEVEKLLASVE